VAIQSPRISRWIGGANVSTDGCGAGAAGAVVPIPLPEQADDPTTTPSRSETQNCRRRMR
jgi:hypothetical protein